MHKIFFSISFFLILISVRKVGYTADSDSLMKIWNNTEEADTNRLNALNKVIGTLLFIDPDSALVLAEMQAEFADEKGHHQYKADAVMMTATSYHVKSKYPEALENYLEALRLYQLLDDKNGQARVYNNMGAVYRTVGDPERALSYYRQCLEIANELNIVKLQGASYNNMGLSYTDLDKEDSALIFFEKSLGFKREIGDIKGEANTLTNIALILELQEKYDEAIEYHLKGITLFQKANSPRGESSSYGYLGRNYVGAGDIQKAISVCNKGLGMAKELKDVHAERVTCQCLYEAYQASGDYKKALDFHKQYILMKDSTENEDLNREMIKKEFEFDYQNKVAMDSIKNAEMSKRMDLELEKERAVNEKQKIIKYILITGIVLVLVLMGFVINRLQITRKQKLTIESQKYEVEHQKMLVESKNKEITDSIQYAERIQKTILPDMSKVGEFFEDSFVLYKPKDIVAGDFYWVDEVDDTIIFAVADCTGHGVPGALVSVVCHGALNRSVHEFGLTNPADILKKTRDLVIETFTSKEHDVNDGMDISLCCLNRKTLELEFAGANNPLYLFTNGELEEIKGDKQPVGRYHNATNFTSHNIKLKKGDILYLFTDGFADQFGGDKGKKFKYQSFKDLIINNTASPMHAQKEKMDKVFETWRGDLEQIDDVCVIGVRI